VASWGAEIAVCPSPIESVLTQADSIATCLPPVNLPDEATNAFDKNVTDISSLGFNKLVELRFAHQTKQAATGVRKRTPKGTTQQNSEDTQIDGDGRKPETELQSLLCGFHEVIKQQQERGKGTGTVQGVV
jgi:hypothetical protein